MEKGGEKIHYFSYKNGELYAEGVKVKEIAEKVGTPVYIYSSATILRHINLYEDAFRGIPHLFCYSVKANSNQAVLKLIAHQKWGADVVSGGELFRAIEAGFPPSRIVFAGVGKKAQEIEQGLNEDILLFNVESEEELEKINLLAKRLKRKARVALRLNPDIQVDTHSYIKTAKEETKFGIPLSQAYSILERRKSFPNLEIKGLHVHLGSQITSLEPYRQAMEKLVQFMDDTHDFFTPSYLDLGGGMGIIYGNEEPFTPEDLSRAIAPYLENRGITLILEPGRFIVGNAGILVTQVLYVKRCEKKNFLIVDAGMNDLIRPALYGAYHEIWPLKEEKRGEGEVYDVVGPVCETGDFLGKERKFTGIKEGDFLAVMGAGAYGFSMASNYNSRPRPAEVLVEENKFFLIRRRETYHDLILLEAIPPHLQETG